MRLRLLILLLLCAALPACGSSNPFSVADDRKFNNSLEASDYAEARFLQANAGRAKRNRADLILNVGLNEQITLTDKSPAQCEYEAENHLLDEGDVGSCVVIYRAVGFWPQKKWFLVDVLYYEGRDALIINDAAAQTQIDGRPVLSPMQKNLLSLNADCSWSVISIWNIAGSSPVHIQTFDIADLITHGDGFISDAVWNGEDAIKLKIRACSDDHSTQTGHLLLQENGTWLWQRQAS